MFENSFVIVDLETTGLNPMDSEIIEIGAIKVIDGKIIDTMDVFVKPNTPVSYFITSLTGITNEMLEDGLNINDALLKFEKFSKGLKLMAHNAKFDVGFLNKYMYDNFNRKILEDVNDAIDTLKLSRIIVNDVPDHKLGTLAKRFNVDYTGAHRSLRDCEITLEVYKNMVKMYNNKNN